MFSLKVVILFGLLVASGHSENLFNVEISLNSYVHPAYPGRCVIDMEPSLITLQLGQAINLPNLFCVQLLCIGDGYGALYKCKNSIPPPNCRFNDSLDFNNFPKCCQRNIVCD